jgi:hypothetical protein
MTPAISRGSFLVGLLVFGSLMIGLPRFIDTPLWLIVLGSLLNAAFYVALVELILSRIRQAAMFQFDDGGP